MKKDFTALFCFVDDFIKNFDQITYAIENCRSKPGPEGCLSRSEVLTILIGFYESGSDCFKNYYHNIVLTFHQKDFKLVSYAHFTKLIGRHLPLLTLLLDGLFDKCSGISFVDATSIAVCENYRIYSHKVFDGFANRGKTSKGWFYGMKLHLIINPEGALVKAAFSSGNKDDRKQFRTMTEGIFGKVFADRGYISKQLFDDLWQEGIQLITRVKSKMKNILMPVTDKILLLKRALIETVIGKIKLLNKLEHSRHRSPLNAFAHMIACLINYQLSENKPSIASLLQLHDPSSSS
jgi:hypothetical protein